jgi:2-polyprenyl-3-methyl-5-hydroxy-6-metoxy-1,4-benzoquinol methylase
MSEHPNMIIEDGIVAGNVFDKYNSKNPIVKAIHRRFDESLNQLVQMCDPKTIHEIGCGEGHWIRTWRSQGLNATGSDFSGKIIEVALNQTSENNSIDIFRQKNIYDLKPSEIKVDLLVCCEVLEHLDDPNKAIALLKAQDAERFIFSVPREPIWCFLNVLRGKYWSSFGNTPGHLQHWSRSSFLKWLSLHFEIIESRVPIPWTMVLCRKR